jgi:hypothetical protein
VNDGRPNGELLLSTGTLQEGNMSDCLYFPASLIAADRCGDGGCCSWQQLFKCSSSTLHLGDVHGAAAAVALVMPAVGFKG